MNRTTHEKIEKARAYMAQSLRTIARLENTPNPTHRQKVALESERETYVALAAYVRRASL